MCRAGFGTDLEYVYELVLVLREITIGIRVFVNGCSKFGRIKHGAQGLNEGSSCGSVQDLHDERLM